MPTYDYQCDSCEAQFEASQSIHDDPLRDCPHCQEPQLRRLIFGAGLIFKGSGFYVNDSKKTESKNPSPKNTANKNENPADNSAKNDPSSSSEKPQSESGAKAAASP